MISFYASMATPKNVFLNQVLDPSSQFVVRWNTLTFVVGLMNFYLDPMFMYIAWFDETKLTVSVDKQLGIILSSIRIMGDCFMIIRILVKFRTAYEAPGSRIFRRRQLIEEPRKIAIKYFKSTFTVDLLAILPLPQACIRKHILASRTASETQSLGIDRYINLCTIYWIQFLPRFLVVVCSKVESTITGGIMMKSGMSGALYNLLWFMNSSNVVGAMYYFQHIIWIYWCRDISESKVAQPKIFKWDKLLSNCSQYNENELGMFAGAFENKIGMRKNFIQRYMFCFSWGLKSLSSLGQNFTTSFSTSETTMSIFITLGGLIFFADLITRMQAGIQSIEEREEQQRARQREVKEWMDYHQLPLHLKEHVDHAIQSEWAESGIDDETMLESLPMDLRYDIRKYLYMDSICKLPKFANVDTPLVEAICQHLKTFSCKESTYIAYEGDIVKQMVFMFNGQLELSFTDRGNSSLTILGPGECCGQELVTWASQPTTSVDNLPSSTWTIKCLTDVEAFVLHAYDMKILATQFAHNQEFQRAFKQHYP